MTAHVLCVLPSHPVTVLISQCMIGKVTKATFFMQVSPDCLSCFRPPLSRVLVTHACCASLSLSLLPSLPDQGGRLPLCARSGPHLLRVHRLLRRRGQRTGRLRAPLWGRVRKCQVCCALRAP